MQILLVKLFDLLGANGAMNRADNNEIEVIVLADSETRGWRSQSRAQGRQVKLRFSPDELSKLLKSFIEAMGTVLQQAPSIPLGDFEFAELHVNATISGSSKADAHLAILSIGGEVGISGALGFVFRKKTTTD